ncbi:MAG: hypothetical protein LBJ92_01480 [Holosporales bacterium]|jgi:hypothetical protein|nr:hypothetical protein [Holosporales bacterium]
MNRLIILIIAMLQGTAMAASPECFFRLDSLASTIFALREAPDLDHQKLIEMASEAGRFPSKVFSELVQLHGAAGPESDITKMGETINIILKRGEYPLLSALIYNEEPTVYVHDFLEGIQRAARESLLCIEDVSRDRRDARCTLYHMEIRARLACQCPSFEDFTKTIAAILKPLPDASLATQMICALNPTLGQLEESEFGELVEQLVNLFNNYEQSRPKNYLIQTPGDIVDEINTYYIRQRLPQQIGNKAPIIIGVAQRLLPKVLRYDLITDALPDVMKEVVTSHIP